MTLVPYNKKELGELTFERTSNLKILEEFIRSDLDCARVDGYTHHNAGSCASSLRASIKRFGMHGIMVIKRKDDIFLVKVK